MGFEPIISDLYKDLETIPHYAPSCKKEGAFGSSPLLVVQILCSCKLLGVAHSAASNIIRFIDDALVKVLTADHIRDMSGTITCTGCYVSDIAYTKFAVNTADLLCVRQFLVRGWSVVHNLKIKNVWAIAPFSID